MADEEYHHPPQAPQAMQEQVSTKDRLSTIVNGFDEFESEMKIGTRQRREKDEFRIAELKTGMKRLDTELLAEIKRRTEMNKSTQMWFEQNLTIANTSMQNNLADRKQKTQERLDELRGRILAMEQRFAKERRDILDLIDARGRELTRLLNEFQLEFETDRADRLTREEAIVKRLTDHEHHVGEHFEKQIDSREHQYSAVRGMLEKNIKLREKAEEKFQSYFEREISKLQNDLRIESEVREREDDEIIEALNRYTQKLQTSLKVVNSTEM